MEFRSTVMLMSLLLGSVSVHAVEPQRLVGHTEPVYTGVYTPDGTRLVTASFDKTLRVWDRSTATTLNTLKGHTGLVLSLAISRDGSRLASGSLDNSVRLWDLPSSHPTATLQPQQGSAVIAIDADGSEWLTSGHDKMVRLWTTANRQLVKEFGPFPEPINRIAIRGDKQQIAIADQNGDIRLISRNDGMVQHQFKASGTLVTALAYVPNQSGIIASTADGSVKRWSTDTGAIQFQQANQTRINSLIVLSSGIQYLTAGDDGSVRLWEVADGKMLREFKSATGPVLSVALSPNQQQMAVGGNDKILRLWNINDPSKPQQELLTPAEVTRIVYSADQKKLIVAGGDRIIRGYDPNSTAAAVIKSEPHPAVQTTDAHPAAITGLEFAADNRTAFSSAADGSVRVWTMASSQSTLSLTGHTSQVYTVAFHPTLPLVASGSNDKTVKIWDYEKNQNLRTFPAQDKAVYSLAFTPDGKHIVASGAEKTVRLYKQDDGSVTQQFTGPAEAVYSVAISPSGQQIAAAGLERTIFCWNTDSPNPIKSLTGHPDDVYKVEFDSTGSRLLSVGYSGQVMVWQLSSSQPLFQQKLPAILYSGTFSPDGRQVALFANDGHVYLRDLPAEAQSGRTE